MAIGYVRAARPPEAEAIAGIQRECWQVSHRRLLPARVVTQIDQEWLQRRWQAAITSPPSGRHRVLVAIEQAAESRLVGFAAVGPADEQSAAPDEPSPPDPASTAAITELMVSPRWGRRGHGSRLLAACVDHCREAGFAIAVAWIFEQDPAARSFLVGAGWEPDGARRILDVDDLLVPQLRLHTRISD